MTKYTIAGFIAGLLVVALFTFIFYSTYPTQCHGQCGHGDQQCQEHCFAKGECPMDGDVAGQR